jgi:hypothetical protein
MCAWRYPAVVAQIFLLSRVLVGTRIQLPKCSGKELIQTDFLMDMLLLQPLDAKKNMIEHLNFSTT